MEIEKSEIEGCIHERFEKVANNYPNHLAIQGQGISFTYAELDCRANEIAHLILKDPNSKEGGTVAILMKKSPLVVVGMLAILKAGRVYTCIDPGFPLSRMQFMMEDSRAGLILTDEHKNTQAEQLLESRNRSLVVVSNGPPSSGKKPALKVSPDQIAYFIYTSGSTGRPKAVMQNHRNVIHYTRNYTNGIKLQTKDRLSLLGSFAFGAATMDVFAGLLKGASLFTLDMKDCTLKEFSEFLIQEKITVYHSVPSVLRHLMDYMEGERQAFPDLRIIDLGGELVRLEDVNRFQRLFSKNCILVNGYGCTELNVMCQFHVGQNTLPPCDPIPVGAAVEDVEILLLDEEGNPVEDGQVGEIVIRSPYSSRGYWNLPELTADRFQDDSIFPGNRLFFTKDHGYMLPDKRLVLKGRKDDMHKIRGFRVEIGEVEHALTLQEDIQAAAVKVITRPNQEKQIVGYYVVAEKKELSPAMFRTYLLKNLPEFMVPVLLIPISELPRTETGKPDKKALPLPTHFLHENTENSSSSHGLASIWSKLLHCPMPREEDHFFHLGGDSLTVMHLIYEVKKAFRIDWKVRDVYNHPTFQEQKKMLSGEFVLHSSFITQNPAGPIRISLAMERFLTKYKEAPNAKRVYRIRGQLNVAHLQKAWLNIQTRHPILKTPIQKIASSGYSWAESASSPLPLNVIDVQGVDKIALEALIQKRILSEIQYPFQPLQEPMCRSFLFRLNEKEYIFLLLFHHLVFDAFSWSILFEELRFLYSSQYEPSLPEIGYSDLCLWESSVDGRRKRAQAEIYWRKHLSNFHAVPIPKWKEKKQPEKKTVYRSKPVIIAQENFEALKKRINEKGYSFQIFLLTAYNILLYLYTKTNDLVIDFPVTGRNRKWMESTIGCFVRDLALRVPISGDPSLEECLQKVKDAVLEAYEYQEISLADLNKNGSFCEFPFTFHFRRKETDFSLLGMEIEPFQIETDRITKKAVPGKEGYFGFHALILEAILEDDKIVLMMSSRQTPPDEKDLNSLMDSLKQLIVLMIKDPKTCLSRIEISE